VRGASLAERSKDAELWLHIMKESLEVFAQLP
jgi:hypothetical protein